LWICLSRLWRDWRSALAIVKPETVIAWHRAGFRLFWTWKVRHGPPGRPVISHEVRDHPPPPVRIKYVIQVAEMWCGQNGFVARQSWFSPARFQELFRVAAEVAEGEARQSWDSQMTFLRSVEGAQYDQQLLDMFEAERQKGPFSKKVDVMPPRL
jgi:hypothetical protein